MAIRKATGVDNWYIIISRGRGQKQITTKYHGSEAGARDVERELKGEPLNDAVKVQDIYPLYLEWYQVNRLPRSVGEMQDTFKRLLPHYGRLPAAFITSGHHEAYKAARQAETWQGRQTSKITINRELKRIMALLRWAAERGMIPMPKIRPEKFPRLHQERESRPIEPLTASELTALYSHLNGPTRILYLLMFWCGLRKTEATKLTVGQVDLSAGMIRIEGKGGKRRVVAIPAELVPELQTATADKAPTNLVAGNPHTGFPYGDLRTPLETAAKAAGITKRIHPHGLRHSYGTALILAGASVAEVQETLGHSDISTTRKYIHLAGTTAPATRITGWMSESVSKPKT